MLHTYLNGQHKYGILANLKAGIDMTDAMNRAASYTLMPEEFDYQVIDLIFRILRVKMPCMPESYYFFPISKDEIEKNRTSIRIKTGEAVSTLCYN